MGSGIKVVLFSALVAVLLGFTLLPTVEGALGWNGFLKEVGFDPPSVYEVTDSTVILAGELDNEILTLFCRDGDWREDNVNFVSVPSARTEFSKIHDTDAVNILDPVSESSTGTFISKKIGYSVLPQLIGSETPLDFDIEVFVTILCQHPSSMMTVGGEWVATDTTALIIGYSVLNAYWLAPIGIGIGVGVYLVKRKF